MYSHHSHQILGSSCGSIQQEFPPPPSSLHVLSSPSSVYSFAFYPSSSRPASPSSNKAGSAIAAIAFAHAALFLFPAMLIALPKPSPREMGNAIFIGFTLIVNTWIALFFVLWQFYPQYLEIRRMSGATGALSLLSLAFQAVVIIAVAVRWLLRLGTPTWGEQSVPLWYWYKWGNLSFSYILSCMRSDARCYSVPILSQLLRNIGYIPMPCCIAGLFLDALQLTFYRFLEVDSGRPYDAACLLLAASPAFFL